MTQAIQHELKLIQENILKVVPETEAIYLFGSYAYGTPHADSDLDIYVVVPDSVKEYPLDIGVEIRKSLRNKRTMPMDLLVGKASVFHNRKLGSTIENTIAKDGVKLYGI